MPGIIDLSFKDSWGKHFLLEFRTATGRSIHRIVTTDIDLPALRRLFADFLRDKHHEIVPCSSFRDLYREYPFFGDLCCQVSTSRYDFAPLSSTEDLQNMFRHLKNEYSVCIFSLWDIATARRWKFNLVDLPPASVERSPPI